MNSPSEKLTERTDRNPTGRSDVPRRKLGVHDAAQFWAVSKSLLDKLRLYGGGPPFIRLGRRRIVYDVGDLEQWSSTKRVES